MIKDKKGKNCPPWTVARSIKLKKIKRGGIAPLDSCQVNKVDKIEEKKRYREEELRP